jgi:hypothetical protein
MLRLVALGGEVVIPFVPQRPPRPAFVQVACTCGQELLVVRQGRDAHQGHQELCDGCRWERDRYWHGPRD